METGRKRTISIIEFAMLSIFLNDYHRLARRGVVLNVAFVTRQIKIRRTLGLGKDLGRPADMFVRDEQRRTSNNLGSFGCQYIAVLCSPGWRSIE